MCTWCDFDAGVVSGISTIFTVPPSTFDAREDQSLSIQRGAQLSHGASHYRLPLFPHLAILLFCAGLVTYFFTFNKVVACTALAVYSVIAALYFR